MRYVLTIVGLVVLLGGLGAVKGMQIGKLIAFGDAAAKSGPPPEAVASAVAREQEWETTISAVGTVASGKGVTISNDAPGVVHRIRFESGESVPKGRVLVELDTSVERAQLASAIARRDFARTTAERTRTLGAQGAIAKAQVDADESQRRSTETEVEALQAQIDRKIVKAPFAGKLGIRQVNLGQYLAPGTPVTVLESVEAVHVDFSVPQQRLPDVAVGMPLRIALEVGGPPIDGTVGAVAPAVEVATRNVNLRGDIANEDDRLRAGMFVKVAIILPEKKKLVVIPATAIVHAPYGDSVFVVEDKPPGKIARQQFVRVSETRGDFVAIEKGLEAGKRVVTAGAFKLRNNAPIALDDSKQPKPELEPKPENR